MAEYNLKRLCMKGLLSLILMTFFITHSFINSFNKYLFCAYHMPDVQGGNKGPSLDRATAVQSKERFIVKIESEKLDSRLSAKNQLGNLDFSLLWLTSLKNKDIRLVDF